MHYFSGANLIILGIILAFAGWAVIEFALWLLSFIHVSIG